MVLMNSDLGSGIPDMAIRAPRPALRVAWSAVGRLVEDVTV